MSEVRKAYVKVANCYKVLYHVLMLQVRHLGSASSVP
jgi:hypothetical protein